MSRQRGVPKPNFSNDGNAMSRVFSFPIIACTGAVASMLTPASALAINVGELRVQSALGQPLNASVPVELGAGEYLAASCLALRTDSAGDLAGIPQARATAAEASTPGTHEVLITTARPLYEPMYSLSLEIKCPGTAIVVRQYVLMLDLPSVAQSANEAVTSPPESITAGPVGGRAAAEATVPGVTPEASQSGSPAASAAPAPRRMAVRHHVPAKAGATIVRGSTYRVQAGDTLSTIAARVSDRSTGGLWRVADEIFAANPAAFIGGSRDLIMLGSEIRVPDASTGAPGKAANPPTTHPAEAPGSTPAPVSEQVVEDTAPAATPATPPTALTAPEQVAPAAAPPPPASVFADEQPTAAASPAEAPAPGPAPAVVSQAKSDHAGNPGHPFLAAVLGLVLGAGLSLLLLRGRLIESLRNINLRRKQESDEAPLKAPFAVPSPPAAPKPVAVRTGPPREAAMVVVETRAEATGAFEATTDNLPVLAVEAPASETPASGTPLAETSQTVAARVDSGLADLYNEATLNAEVPDTLQMPGASTTATLDLDLTEAMDEPTATNHVEEIGWVGDEEADPTRTQHARAPSPTQEVTANMDLQALAKHDTSDETLSQTLRDALALLEQDYEDEFSASQVLRMKRGTPEAKNDEDENTVLRTGTGRNRRP